MKTDFGIAVEMLEKREEINTMYSTRKFNQKEISEKMDINIKDVRITTSGLGYRYGKKEDKPKNPITKDQSLAKYCNSIKK